VPVTNLFIKVEVELAEDEAPEKLGAQVCRQILRVYGVRSAELTNFTAVDE
jgi:hypothetical protein